MMSFQCFLQIYPTLMGFDEFLHHRNVVEIMSFDLMRYWLNLERNERNLKTEKLCSDKWCQAREAGDD